MTLAIIILSIVSFLELIVILYQIKKANDSVEQITNIVWENGMKDKTIRFLSSELLNKKND